MTYDYFYGQQAEMFTFYRVPKVLFTEDCFWNVSTDAKLLYGILLDRMNLSARNGWLDEEGRVYIIFTIEEIKGALGCAEKKAVKLLDELEKRQLRPAFHMSFDGVGWHDWMRGVQGAEKIVVDAMCRCRERGIPTSAAMVLFKENKGSIRESVNLMASLGCRALKINNASPQGEWKPPLRA